MPRGQPNMFYIDFYLLTIKSKIPQTPQHILVQFGKNLIKFQKHLDLCVLFPPLTKFFLEKMKVESE